MNREIIAIFSLALILIYVLFPPNARATSYDSVANGDWNTPSIWNPVGTPSTGDDVTIDNNNQIGVSSSVAAADVNFASNGTVSMSGGSGITGDITATGAGTAGTGTVTLNGNDLVTGSVGTSTDYLGTINAGASGVSEITGTVDAAALNMVAGGGSLQLDEGGIIIATNFGTNNDTLILNTSTNIAGFYGNIFATGAGTIGAGTLTLTGNGSSFSGQIGTSTDYLGTINVLSSSEILGTVNAAVLNMGPNSALQLDFANDNITTTNFGTNNGALVLAVNANLTGNITATGAGTAGVGVLELADDNTVNGQIGTSTDYLGTIYAGTNGGGPIGSLEITGAVNAALIIMGTGDGSGGGVLTLDTTSHITSTVFDGADTLVLNNADLTGNIDFNNNAGTVTVTNGNSIAGTVENSTGTSAEGTLTFEGSTATGGNIGAAGTQGLLAVNFDGVGASSILGNDIFAATTTINDSATITTYGNRDITGALTLAGTSALNVGATTLTVNGAYTQGADTSLDLAVNSPSSFGKIISTVAASVAGGSIINVAMDGYVPNNAILTIINTGGAGIGSAPSTVTSDNSVIDFSSSILDGNLVLLADNDLVSFADNPNARALAAVLANVTNPSNDMQTALSSLVHLSDAQITAALNTMGPIVDGGVKENSFAMLNNFVGASLDRIQDVFTRNNIINADLDKAETGVSSGDQPGLNGIWAKPYGSYLTQGTLQGIQGYNAWNAGTVVGLDRLISDDLTLGVSGAYAYGLVDGEVNGASTDISSAQGTIYAGYQDPGSNYFIDAAGSFDWNWYDGRRDISFINRTADSDYEGQQYGAYIESGYRFNMGNNPEYGQWLGDNLEFTPLISLQWTHLSLGSYTESNAGSLDLNVNKQNYDILESGIGGSISSPEKYDWGIFTPEIHARWLYDYIDDDMVVISSFTGGGGSFTSNGAAPAKDGLDLGSKLSFDLKNDISLIANGDIEERNKFFGIYGSGTVRYKF